MDCGDGIRRADAGSMANGTASNDKIASATLAATDTGKVFTNKGAVGTVQLTLPVAKFGMWFTFAVFAAQTFEVLPGSGAKINGGSTKISAAGSQALVGVATVACLDGTNWYATDLTGTWTTS